MIELSLQKKVTFLFVFCCLTTEIGFSQSKSTFEDLNQLIKNYANYDQEKLFKIDSIRNVLKKTEKSDLLVRYKLSEQMFYEFKFFKRDSAFYYGIQSKTLALKLKDKSLIANSNMNLADICVSSGMYKEALELFLSPNYFGDLIKKETGSTALDYIQSRLIDEAKLRMFDATKNINDIATELGFKYQQHFTRLFKLKTTVTPNEYRNLN